MISDKNCSAFLAELGYQIFRGQWRKLRHFNSYHQFEQAAGENILQITFSKMLATDFLEKI